MKNNTDKMNSNLKKFWLSRGGEADIEYKNVQVMPDTPDELKIERTYSE